VYNKIDKRDLKIGRYVHVYDLILFNDLNVMKQLDYNNNDKYNTCI